MDKPLFSIVIPTYNHAAFIGRCLDSVVGQSFNNWEAIVVNNYSTDNTIEIVEGYNDSRIRLINNHNDGIIAVSRNKGIEAARGEWVCFLDSDDWWTPNKLETCLPYLNPNDMIYHRLKTYSEHARLSGVVLPSRTLDSANPVADIFINGNPIANSSVAMRRELLEQIGRIDTRRELIAVEDVDCWIRAILIGARLQFVDQVLGYYWLGENISKSTKQIERAAYVFERYASNLAPDQLRQAQAKLAYDAARLYHMNAKYKEAQGAYRLSLRGKVTIKAVAGYLLCLARVNR